MVTHYIIPQIAHAEQTAENHSGLIKTLMMDLQQYWRENVLETEISGIPKIIMAEAANFPELPRLLPTWLSLVLSVGNFVNVIHST